MSYKKEIVTKYRIDYYVNILGLFAEIFLIDGQLKEWRSFCCDAVDNMGDWEDLESIGAYGDHKKQIILEDRIEYEFV